MADCVFCKIIRGELPSYCVYEDEYFKGILDIGPWAEGHVIMISKEHAESVLDLPDETAKHAMPAVKKVVSALKDALACDGVNILQNNGEAAGQSVGHFHMHVIPRKIGDGIVMNWPHFRLDDERFKEIAGVIREKIQ